ncbi:MotA/TolQ/ExbB proton channel family protein [Tichowtungia aerotolerans]|uniref:MotA/TolQ/ExbB proton channel family protein n=1 Tax=Tichowtungia aerotolerans TaxID=2697043 RepID=A0A6P1M2U9_9BACT|nr:MotA/TolQ/ExbB proton channel family protein [Tichowtungia aerotolerans]QHI68930.1 MotA/TolQ/ExbB proton channel family protein [Tichowtungia aerotolerans]
MKRTLDIRLLTLGLLTLAVFSVQAQDVVMNEAAAGAEALGTGDGFLDVVIKGGFLGIVLWLSLAALSVAGTHLIVDSFLKIKEKRFIPTGLIDGVRSALGSGDVSKAKELCDEEPGALSNILSAGFINIGDGAEDAVSVATELESEKLMQRVNYLNVVGNLAPMLGLLGTVQGMIMAFATLGTEAGAAKNAMLATNISQALYTTAAGLVIAVPALGFFSFFRNRAAKISLNMEALTMELMKKARD